MCKKVLLVGLVASMSVQAMNRGQELQVVVKTPVAQAIRWLSNGTPEANVAAGVIAATFVYAGASLVTSPYRAWSNRSSRRMHAEQLSDIVNQVKENHKKLAESVSRSVVGDVLPASVVTAEQLDEKTKQFEQKLAVITAALEASKKQETILVNRLAVIEQKAQQPVDHNAASQSAVSAERITGLEERVLKTEGSIKTVVTKTENLPFLATNFAKAQEDIIRLESQLNVLQNTVLTKLGKSDKPVDKVIQSVDKK